MSTATINAFYTAFAQLDTAQMSACYADNAHFQDEVFDLQGKTEIMGMWGMLCDAVKAKGRSDWQLSFSEVQASGHQGSAHWEPIYRFTATGRLVHNVIDAQFVFDERGLITSHRDSFDFWSWSRQALGTPGLLLGWSPVLRRQVKKQANASLRKYLQGRATS